VGLQPILAVCEVVIFRVRREPLLQGGDDPARIGAGARAASGNEDHAVVARAARRDRLVVDGSHIDEVVGYYNSTLIACEVNDTTIIEGAPLWVLLDRLNVVTTSAQLPRDRGREHLIE
jgi:hypothetical protein